MWKYIKLLRPADWIKNLFVFAGVAFGGGIGQPEKDELAVLAFVCFCMASSAGYIINDIMDRERDRLHPTKCNRPIASGAVGLGEAVLLFIALLVGAGALSLIRLPAAFTLSLASYLVLTLSYSLYLKHKVILDVLVIAMLFVIRALAGAFAVEVPVSHWLVVCTFMLCLFLGFGKRRCEIAMLGSGQAIQKHRATLVRYTSDLLNHLLATSGGIAVITFLLYTLDKDYPSPFGERRQLLVYTLPLVVYGIFRYALLIELGQATGPTDLVVKDRPLLLTIVLWTVMTVTLLYMPGNWESLAGASQPASP